MELEAFKEVQRRRSEGSKPHSTPSTLEWLDENYELAQGVCIPRSSLYLHYLDFCEKTDTVPVNAASFGKIIRQQFSQLTTRRLGTRGQSKYHYYGIAIRESSAYYEAVYSKSGVSGIGNEATKKDAGKQNIAYSPRSKLGTLLPEFPDIKDINLPANVPEAKVSTFIMMYRTHCQRILDTVIRANFDEVQNYLLHFWQGMPSHIIPILGSTSVVNIVGVCDSILYKAIASVLMPSVLQALPDSLTQVIRKFAYELDDWLKFALSDLPDNLRFVKFQVSKGFTELLKLQTSLNHLCQASKTVINNSDIVSQMLEDWELVDFPDILCQTMYTLGEQTCEAVVQLINDVYQEFGCLLDDHASIEAYTEWLDSIINRCIVKPSTDHSQRLHKLARCFLLNWSSVSTRIIRDLTLHSAPSFGSYHLMHLMFDDYVSYTIGMLLAQSRAVDMKEGLKRQLFVELKEPTSNVKFDTSSPYSSTACPKSHFAANVFKSKSMLGQLDMNPAGNEADNTGPSAEFNKVAMSDTAFDYTFYPFAMQVDNEQTNSVRSIYEQQFTEIASLRKRDRKKKSLQIMRNDSLKDNNIYQMPYERDVPANNIPLFPNTFAENAKRFRHTASSPLNQFGSEQGASNITFQECDTKLSNGRYLGQFSQSTS